MINLYQTGKIRCMKPYKLHNKRQNNQLSKIEISLTAQFMEMTQYLETGYFCETFWKGGTGKLPAHWENTIYVVVGREYNLPVYNIKPEYSKGTSTKKVHHNIIMPCNLLPSTSKINNNKNYNKISQDKSIQSDSNVTGDNSGSDRDSEIIILQP